MVRALLANRLRIVKDRVPRREIVQIAGAVRPSNERSNVIHPESLARVAAGVASHIGESADEKTQNRGDDGFGDIFCVPILKNLNITRKIAQ